MRSTLLCILLCISSVAAYSQQLIFFRPENLKQLPSSETYNIMQDSKGYIWFSTETGLCRYNGDNVKVFDEDAGLPEGATYFVTEDKKGTIWVGTSRNRILKFDGSKFIEAPFTKKALNYMTGLHQIANFSWLNDSVMQICTQFDSVIRININSNQVTELPPVKTEATFYVEIQGSRSFIKNGPNNTIRGFTMLKEKKMVICIVKENKKTIVTIPYDRQTNPSWIYNSAINKKGELWVSIDRYLIKLDPDGSAKTYSLNAPILTMKCDANDGIWIGMLHNGLYYLPAFYMERRIEGLSGLSVSGITLDKEGGVWCTTLEKGVFYCRNRSVIDYSNRDDMTGKIELLKYFKGHVFVSARKECLVEIKSDTLIRHNMPVGSLGPISAMVRYGKNWLISSNHFMFSYDSSFTNPIPIIYKRKGLVLSTGSKFLINDNAGRVYAANYGTFSGIEGNELKMLILRASSGIRSLAFASGEILLGCKDGLYQVRDTVTQKILDMKTEISGILASSDGATWLLARNNGVYRLKQGNLVDIRKKLSLKTKRFSDIAEDKFGNIWLASNMGIIKLTPAQNGYRETYYNTLSGLPSNEIVHITSADSLIYFSTPDGVASFPIPEKLRNETPPLISVADVKVNNKGVPFTSGTLHFPYYENTVKVKLNIFTYRRAGAPPTIWYNLNGSDKDFQVLRSDELNLANLSPGKYHLKICAVNNDGVVSKKPVELFIEIQPPFWKTTIFLVCLIAVLLVLVYVIVRIITKGIRKREKEKTRINTMLAEYHMSALRAQMNPHFIFNCINSIQRYILTNQSKEAYNYLTKFSRLIRLVLNYAEKNMITLQQELEIVELYLSLEQLRFGDKFTYSIHLDPIPADKLYVPVLIIQPYVENAIWHGIMNLPAETKGHIHITASLQNDVLIIKIEDNGVGREVAAQFSKKDHDSKSTWINKKRAEIVNMEGAGMENVLLEDIIDENGAVRGTRAIIRIKQTKPLSHE